MGELYLTEVKYSRFYPAAFDGSLCFMFRACFAACTFVRATAFAGFAFFAIFFAMRASALVAMSATCLRLYGAACRE